MPPHRSRITCSVWHIGWAGEVETLAARGVEAEKRGLSKGARALMAGELPGKASRADNLKPMLDHINIIIIILDLNKLGHKTCGRGIEKAY